MNSRYLIPFFLLGFSFNCSANSTELSLADELETLKTPENEALKVVDGEKMYAVQTRFNPLKNRHEVAVLGARNFTADNFIDSNEVGLQYRYHISDKVNLALAGTFVFNELSESGTRLFQQESLFPDVAYAKNRFDLLFTYNLFYGKFRLALDSVLYFDFYASAGPGYVIMGNGEEWAAVGDVGFNFWFGKNISMRMGMKDYFQNEARVKTNGMANNVVGHMDVAYLFGE